MANAPAPLHFSRIGLGCATFGREIDENASFAMMDDALARGITLFDTAAAYSAGASERIVGAWLEARRPPPGSLTVATKIYPPYEPAAIAQAVAQSGGRLGAHGIDLLYLHRWDATAETPGALQSLDALVREGVVRAIGVSNFNAEQLGAVLALQASLELAPFRALQNNHNFAVRDIDPALREHCARHKIAIVTYSPLGAGFLTGKHRQGVPEGTRFAIIPGHQRVYFHDSAWRRLDRLERVAAQTGHPQTQLALAWVLQQPGVASVLVGGRTPAHLDQAFAALAFDDPPALAALEDAESV
jgi:aryl-alcohol dehydrogenase-like predicted oxidoreductase